MWMFGVDESCFNGFVEFSGLLEGFFKETGDDDVFFEFLGVDGF